MAAVCGTLASAGVICLGLPFHDEHPTSRGLLDKHTILVLQILPRSCSRMLAPELCSSEECTSILFVLGDGVTSCICSLRHAGFESRCSSHLSSRTHFWKISRFFYVKMDFPSFGCFPLPEEHKKSVSSVIDCRESHPTWQVLHAVLVGRSARSRCLWKFSRRAPSRVHLSPGRGCTWYVHVPM